MRCRIASFIDGLNWLFNHGEAEMFGGNEHFQFEFITRRGNAQHAFDEPAGNGSQPGLRVGKFLARDYAHYGVRDGIPKAAAQRDVARKGSRAEYERIRIRRKVTRNSVYIGWGVLRVSIDGDDSRCRGISDQNSVHAGLESGTFSEIHGVPENPDSFEPAEFFKDCGITRPAAIVYDDDRAETKPYKRLDEFHQYRAGPIGRNQNGCGNPCGIRRHRPLL